ncbi:disease resistance RPM1-like [Olea europaea subsp. europaea]|uniref:Disease resistance RPM1-like n=1 Tax=Olea europaea subsp. europaea TaxID=158383 RepID=A0A8S0V6M1_OLEEU|nr:disease resistance RPM1-like [Olea europaea subsp. europaea]
MAESVVSFLLNQLATLTQEERQLLGRLDENVQHIQSQLEFMRASLRDADAEEDGDPQLQAWVKQVREWNGTDVNYDGVRLRGPSTLLFDGRVDAILVDEVKLVGIDRPKELLIKELLDDETWLKAVSVWGMGGLGKSTLVKQIYEDERVKGKLQCHAWITVSQSFDIMKLLKDLIRKLHDEIKEPMLHELELKQEVELKEFVKKILFERHYIIVFDDAWSTRSWDALKHALSNKNMSSRVVLTTRTLDVANLASQPEYPGCHDCVHEMEALSYEDSRKLLCNKTFGDEIFPPHLQDCADGILDKCMGLPLAIDAVGGLLGIKDKNSIEEWSTVCSYLNTKLHGYILTSKELQVLLLSYYDLSYDLKTCVLYLSIFPEDHMIDHMRLIRFWIAEGFVQGKERLTKEEVALRYLEVFINRSLIQVAERYLDGRVYLCRILDILVSKSNEQNIVNTEIGRDSELPNKVQRFAIRTSIDSGHLETNRLKYLRSLILIAFVDSRFESFLSKLLSGSRKLLKVLDLRDAPLGKISNEVFKHYHLTYLSLRGIEVKVIPESIGQLQCLETLDLKDTEVISLPIEILKLKRLRHLLVYKYKPRIYSTVFPFDNVQSFKAPYRIGCLSSLQKLCYIEADQMGNTTIDDLDFKFPRTLFLVGRLEKVPQWIPSLHSLTRVALRHNKLSNDPLESLQDLPSLAHLPLDVTFEGEKLEFKAEKFQRLKTLFIWSLNG